MSHGVRAVVCLVALLWCVEAIDQLFQLDLPRYGIRPRSADGLVGIPLAPFLHAGWDHLIANTLPLVVLGGMATFGQRRSLFAITVPIVVLGGLGTWVIAAGGVHVGASGLVFGYFGYVLARGVFAGHLGLLLIGILAILLYGGMIWGVLPSRPDVSWESHACGLAAGLLVGRDTPPDEA
jgi:membrane associated rhomboid family serine protease